MLKTLWASVLLFILALPLVWPFLIPGYFPTHDGEWAIIRLSEMHREIKDRQLPPRWSNYLNHGFGYPLFLFTYPFPYYLAEGLHLLGSGVTMAIKLVFVISIILSAVTMYLLGSRFWGWWGGLTSAVLYLYAPYRLVNLYIRGSIGESLALVFYPLLFYLTYELVRNKSGKLVVFTAGSWGMFILTHNAMVVLFAPFLGIWLIYSIISNRFKRKSGIIYLGLSLILGLVITAYFWLPALIEKKFLILTLVPLADKSAHYIRFKELLATTWNFTNRPPVLIGNSALFLFLALCFKLIWFKFKEQTKKLMLLFLLGMTGLSIYLMFPASSFIWQLPLLKDIDFPWRVMGVVIFLLSFTTGMLTMGTKQPLVSIIMIAFAIVFNIGYIKTQTRFIKPDSYYETNDATTTSAEELLPAWVKIKPSNRPSAKATLLLSGEEFKPISETSSELKFNIIAGRPSPLVVKVLYFPGWKAYLNGREIQLSKTEETGLLRIDLPSGNSNLSLKFQQTPVRRFADYLSLGGLMIMICLWIYTKEYSRYY